MDGHGVDFTIRNARPDDVGDLAGFTTDTFTWGDYVVDSLDDWLADERGVVLVAVTDAVIGVVRVLLLSDREAWIHAARVHPESRRRGVGRALNDAACSWARGRGAVVARLLVEDWNQPASAQVVGLGYRPVARWTTGLLSLEQDIHPHENGHRRLAGEERLTPGRSSESDLAWMSWTASETAHAGRGLFPIGWHFRTMRPQDLVEAAKSRSLWQCPSGWAVIDATDPSSLMVPWISTSDLDVDRLLRAIADFATERNATTIRIMVPRLDWMIAAIERASYVHEPNTLYAKDLLAGDLLAGDPLAGRPEGPN